MNPFLSKLWRLRELQIQRGFHRGWVYHQLRQQFELGLDELELIAEVLGYRRGWVWHQWKALQNEYASSQLQKPLSLLGLSFPFTKEQLSSTYRRMARLTHPDAGGSHEAFIAINQAYETLKGYLAWQGEAVS